MIHDASDTKLLISVISTDYYFPFIIITATDDEFTIQSYGQPTFIVIDTILSCVLCNSISRCVVWSVRQSVSLSSVSFSLKNSN